MSDMHVFERADVVRRLEYYLGKLFGDIDILDEVKEGDKLSLRREENKYDDKAILILDQDGRKLGYIPEKDNLIFSRLMDAGKLLIGKVDDIQMHGTFHKIRIGIYLVDY